MHQLRELAEIFCKIDDAAEMEQLFEEIFTPRERADIVLRWALLKDLFRGKPQRSIAAELGISLCKITRGSRIIKDKKSVIYKILNQTYGG